MQVVLNEIEKNLEYVDIQDLIDISGYSYYHFHRIFLGYTGESLKRYIRRIRLQNSAYKLQCKQATVTQIALEAGYHTPSSYNKAFKDMFNCSPSKFVKEFNTKKEIKMIEALKIESIDPIDVYSLRHVGDYFKCDTTWNELINIAGKNDLLKVDTKFYGISYDDPSLVEVDKLRYDACITRSCDISIEDKVEVKQIKGGKYAVFLHEGSYNKLMDTYSSAYASLMQNSDIELRDEPPFEQYLTMDVKEEDLRTQIWVPIK
jgi:AraC family transcriptional regulator